MWFRQPPPPHEHCWVTVNVQHSAPAIFTGGIPSTIVLQLCGGCNKPQTLTIQGKWELNDLLLLPEPAAKPNGIWMETEPTGGYAGQ